MAVNDIVMGAAGASGPATYIEDVFSTWLYTGNGSTQTITNGIDLSGKGGLVWHKCRNAADGHILVDTVRGGSKYLQSQSTSGEGTQSIYSFLSDGYTISAQNTNAQTYVDWTFREQPKFFDIVTYTGNGVSGRQIAHNLGSAPGAIIVKGTSTANAWTVYHRSLNNASGGSLYLNSTSAQDLDPTNWNSTNPTSSVFTLGSGATNTNGVTYVAYLFAHDAGGFGATGTDNVISCGSFTSDGSGYATVTLGWEPQYYMRKNITGIGSWEIVDTMRGWVTDVSTSLKGNDTRLRANVSDAEVNTSEIGYPTATGFWSTTGDSDTYIYIAIRRPMKTPTTGTEVFYAGTGNGSATIPAFVTNFTVDMGINRLYRTSATDNYCISRLTGSQYTRTNLTNAENGPETDFVWDSNIGYVKGNFGGAGGYTQAFAWAFKRAAGFFDMTCFSTEASNPNPFVINHNLGVAPELVITKRRNGTSDWYTVCDEIALNKYLHLNSGSAPFTYGGGGTTTWSATATTLSMPSGYLYTSSTYVFYMFATCAGVSKVGSYTGNGSSQTISCGFTTGARFVLIKRTDTTGDWYVWDSARGIVAGNDPHLSLNISDAEVTTDDSVDADSSGFIVNQVAATNVNVTSATYIFLAIA